MPAQFGPLNVHDTQRVYDQINALSDMGLSESDIMRYLGQSQAFGRSALQDYMNAAGMNVAQGFQPQFDQARNTLGANPLLADSGYANRLNRQLLTDLAARESGAYSSAAADLAKQNVGYLQGLQGQRIGLRSGLAGQAYNTILTPPQEQSTADKIRSGVGQAVGAVGGALLGGPQTAGYSAGGALGGSGGYAPGFQQYQNMYYPGMNPMPAGGYSESLGGPRRSMYPWQSGR